MRKNFRLLMLILLTLLASLYAEAEAELGEFVYAQWGEWTMDPLTQSDELEVQTRQTWQILTKDIWIYRRYVYFNLGKGAWYATCTDRPDADVQPGSGRWEEERGDARKAVIGEMKGETEYEGHWFFERSERVMDSVEPVTQYRGRVQSRVECVLDEPGVAMGVGDSRMLGYRLAEGVRDIRFESSDPSVVGVDENGVMTAYAQGEVSVFVLRGDKRIAQGAVRVGIREEAIRNGQYMLWQMGSRRFLSFVAAGQDAPLTVSDGERTESGVLSLVQRKDSAFMLGLPGTPEMYLGIVATEGGGNAVTACPREGVGTVHFDVLRLQGGAVLLYPDGEEGLFLGVDAEGGVTVKPFDPKDGTLFWQLEWLEGRPPAPAGIQDGWGIPVKADGRSYVMTEFGVNGHEGIDIGSAGVRLEVISAAKGRVVYAYAGCSHDTPKRAGEQDPCGADAAMGNVVIVEHENGLRTAYAHLSRVDVAEGDSVGAGQVIGQTGSTGQSSGVHLHFEVRNGSARLDPRQYLELPRLGRQIG